MNIDELKGAIVARMSSLGWHKDRIVDVFNKTFETAVAPKKASAWLRFDQADNCWRFYGADFTSAGENVLAVLPFDLCSFPLGMAPDEIEQRVGALVAEMERMITGAYSVRLLGGVERLMGKILISGTQEDRDGILLRLRGVHPGADAACENFEHQMRGVGAIGDQAVVAPEYSALSVGEVQELLLNAAEVEDENCADSERVTYEPNRP